MVSRAIPIASRDTRSAVHTLDGTNLSGQVRDFRYSCMEALARALNADFSLSILRVACVIWIRTSADLASPEELLFSLPGQGHTNDLADLSFKTRAVMFRAPLQLALQFRLDLAKARLRHHDRMIALCWTR